MEELDDAVRGEDPAGYRAPRPVTSWMKPPKPKARSARPAPAAPPPAKDEAPAAPTPRRRRSPVLDGKHHVATTRLDDATYRRLRLYVTTLEQRTGERPTHQDIFTQALDEFLTKNGGD